MKKKIVKYSLLTGCIALFIFLLLPFLEPPSLMEKSVSGETPKEAPQIFTSNPLSAIVSRIARFFNRKSTQPASVQLAGNPAAKSSGNFVSDADAALYAAGYSQEASAAAAAFYASHPASEEEIANPDEANAQLFTEGDEEWVLIRQRTPGTAQSGMHEINLKENAYDKYIKQERLARATPTALPNTPVEVPDSKLARLFNPIKQFFGLEQKPAQTGSLQNGTVLAGSQQYDSDGLGLNKNPKNGALYQKPEAKFPGRFNVSSANSSASQPTTLPSLTDNFRVIRQAAEMVATSLHPNTTTAQEQQDWQQAAQEKEQEYAHIQEEMLMRDLLEKSNGESPKDALPETAGGCDLRRGLLMEESSCPTLDSEFAEIQRNNENLFAELTGGVPLPKDIPLTPVLSVVDTASSLNQLNNSLQLLDQDKDFMLPEEYQSQRATIQMYQFMLQNSHCSSSNCYWVANAPQGESNNFLVYTVKAAGMEFAGDPANKFNKLKQDFIQAQLEAEPNATEERKKEIRKAAEQAAPPYLPYSGKDIVKEGQENNPPAVYFSGAGDARSFIEANGYTAPIFYGEKGHEALSSQDNKTLKDRSSALVKHLAENVRLYGSISQTIQQNANQETVKNTIQPIMQDIRESVQKEMGNSGSLSPHR